MRRKIVAGNWKMNLSAEEAQALLLELKTSMISLSLTDIVVCPPTLYLDQAKEILGETSIKIGAQDCFWEQKGAYTGEVSPAQCKQFVNYVIVGHSERREHLKESDETINKKLLLASKEGLKVILCVGESIEDYRKGNSEVVINQLLADLKGIDPEAAKNILIAYEPIWAIGSGEPATPEYANRIMERIRQEAGSVLGKENAAKMQLLYGGSVNSKNCISFVEQPEIDGLLVGGASLKAQEFINIIREVNKVST